MKFNYSPVAYTGQFWIQENRILECTHCALHCHGTNVSNHLKGKLHRFYQRFILQKTSSIKHPHNCSGVHQNTKLLSGRFPVLQKSCNLIKILAIGIAPSFIWRQLLANFKGEKRFSKMNLSIMVNNEWFYERQRLNTHSVCGRKGLNTHTQCGWNGLNTHGPGYFVLGKKTMWTEALEYTQPS